MRPPRLLRRDGKLRFVKRYKRDSGYRSSILFDKSSHVHHDQAGEARKSKGASVHRKEFKHTEFGADIYQGSSGCCYFCRYCKLLKVSAADAKARV